MMRRFFAVLVILLCLMAALAGAEGIDLTGYSAEELLALREAIDVQLEELARQEAMAHADRRIHFEKPEAALYVGESINQRPSVERMREEAPWRTDFDWSSSNEEVAAVGPDGVVTGISAGDAEIIATTRDNPYISGSYTVHVGVAVEKITIWGPDAAMGLRDGEDYPTQTLTVDIEPEDASCQEITWSSSDEEIATVDGNGVVTGLAPGKAVITATSAENPPAHKTPVTAEYAVQVVRLVSGIEVSESEIAISLGETAQIEATVSPEDAENPEILYSSDNEEIATVSGTGVISGISRGECNILLTAADGGGAEASVHVSVSQKVTGIRVPGDLIRVPIGATCSIEVVVEPEDASNPNLVWTSSNVFVARVANGTVEAVGQGDCEISCSTTDGSGITASIPVRVPTFSVDSDAFVITGKNGIEIPVKSPEGTLIEARSDAKCFEISWKEDGLLAVTPVSAGEGIIVFTNPQEGKDRIEVLITVEDSAVFNENSYPKVSYDELTLRPEEYEGTQICLVGKVLMKTADEEGNLILAVGTGGKDYTDQVIQIKIGKDWTGDEPNVEETATFFGIFRNGKIYSEALGSEVSVPELEVERIE